METIFARGLLKDCRINIFELEYKRNKMVHLVIINENFESPYIYAEDFFCKVEGLTREAAAKYILREFIDHNDLFELEPIYVNGELIYIMKDSVIKDKLDSQSWNKYYKRKFQSIYDWMHETAHEIHIQPFEFNYIETQYNNIKIRLFYDKKSKNFHVWFNAYDLHKILGNDHLNRYYVMDNDVLAWIDYSEKKGLNKNDFMQKIIDIIYLCQTHKE